MMLFWQESIRDVILFPQLKPKVNLNRSFALIFADESSLSWMSED